MKEKITFNDLCSSVRAAFAIGWRDADDNGRAGFLEREKRAIMGYEEDMKIYMDKIECILEDEYGDELESLGDICPSWYPNLAFAIFHELYGLAGLASWVYDCLSEYENSSSAKLIGDRMYCLIDGVSVLQPQRIGSDRRQQLKRALLLSSPRERLETGYHELYLRNGIRITIYGGEKTKPDQDIIVLRKYLLEELTFGKLAELGTIPKEAVGLFEVMVKIGFNIIIAGTVRSGKTTFLRIWQMQEDSRLEGLCLSTDPETPWHILMPEAPLMQLVADGEELENITKSLVRGDNDYVILEEMRDGIAFNLALEIMGTGTHRSKVTVHSSDALNLPFKMATKIYSRYGGDFRGLLQQIFTCYDYVFELCQSDTDKGVKRLKAIWEYCYDPQSDTVEIHQLCCFDYQCVIYARFSQHIGKPVC